MSAPTLPVIVRNQNVYGRELFYPVNGNAHTFADLMNRKTFDREALTRIRKLPLVEIKIEYTEVKL